MAARGRRLGCHEGKRVCVGGRDQNALTVWKWSKFHQRKAIALGKEGLLTSIDETHIPISFAGSRGNVVVTKNSRRWSKQPRNRVSQHEQRTHFTLVAMFCNVACVQPLLPQVIVVG